MNRFKTADLLIWRSSIAMTGCAIFSAIALLAGNLADIIPTQEAQRQSVIFNIVFGSACVISVALAMQAKRRRRLEKQNHTPDGTRRPADGAPRPSA